MDVHLCGSWLMYFVFAQDVSVWMLMSCVSRFNSCLVDWI